MLVVGADADGRLGWNRIRNRFAGKGGAKLRDRELMSGIQDEFHLRVARGMRMDRGEVTGAAGASRKRTETDRDLGENMRLKSDNEQLRVANEQLRAQVADFQAQQALDAARSKARAEKREKARARPVSPAPGR